MDSDDDEFGRLGIPTPLEMWKQQSVLLINEVDELNRQLRDCKRNIAKMIDINADVSAERDRLKRELVAAESRISDCLRQAAQDWATINSLEYVKEWGNNLRAERDQLYSELLQLRSSVRYDASQTNSPDNGPSITNQ